MPNKPLMLLLLGGMLTACTSGPPAPLKTLDEKLVGKTPEQQQDILENACLNEAEKITGRSSMWVQGRHGNVPVNDLTVKRMKSLCFRMSDAYTSTDIGNHDDLARKCQAILTKGAQSQRELVEKHTHRMQDICEKMTGQPLQLEYAPLIKEPTN